MANENGKTSPAGETLKLYTEDVVNRICAAQTSTDIQAIMSEVLARIPQPAAVIFGPIYTGPNNFTPKEKRAIIRSTGYVIREKLGLFVFDYLPLRNGTVRILKHYYGDSWFKDGHFKDLIKMCYEPLLGSGRIQVLCLMQQWNASPIGRWGREFALTNGIQVMEIPERFLPVAAVK